MCCLHSSSFPLANNVIPPSSFSPSPQLLRDVPEGRRPLLPSNVPSLLADLLVSMHSGEPSERITTAKVRDVLASDAMKKALRGVDFVVNGED